MSRRSTGHVVERCGPRGKVFALRFQAYGERRYLTLGSPAEGWTRGRAREEMDNILADVRRGIWVWRRRRARTGLDTRRTTFGPFATRLVAERKGEVSDSQIVNQEWTLGHLLPYFADWSLGLREPHRPVVHLDTAEQVEALIHAAEDLDRDPGFRLNERRAIVAALVFAGPRAVQIGHMLWRDVDLANERLFIGRSKTQAGLREVRMLPILLDILAAHKASALRTGPDDLVFPTHTGGRRDKDNLRSRVLGAVFDRANELLEERGRVPLPRGLTPHKLRHTFASVLIACGEDPTLVTVQLGHTDPTFTLRTYSHLMSRAPGERERLKALVDGERVIAPETPVGPPPALNCSAYEPSILRALARHGGRGSRREIRAAVADDLKGSFGDLDCERLPSGEPRWEARIDKRQRTSGTEQGHEAATKPLSVSATLEVTMPAEVDFRR